MVVARKPSTMWWSRCAQARRSGSSEYENKGRSRHVEAQNRGGKKERAAHAPVMLHRHLGEAASSLDQSRRDTPRKFPNQSDAGIAKKL